MKSSQGDFFCPSCGAEMKMVDGTFACPYCGRKEQICTGNSESEELDLTAIEAESIWLEPDVERCRNCGSESARLAGDTSPCVHCADSVMQPSDKPYGVRPSLIAPFKLTAAQASIRLDSWLKKRFMAPFPFKKEVTSGNMNGLYIPYWKFSASADSEYAGQAGSYYQDTEVNSASSNGRTEAKCHRVRKVRWRMVSGSYNKKFSDVIFGDASHTDAKVIKSIEPFKLNELVKYEDKYLAGFAVERYNTGLKASWGRAKAYMGSIIRGDITAIVKRGSDVTGAINICTSYTDIGYQLMLLPIWISAYRFRKKAYNIYINGQTGELYGKSPVSVLKIAIIVLALAAASALLIWLL